MVGVHSVKSLKHIALTPHKWSTAMKIVAVVAKMEFHRWVISTDQEVQRTWGVCVQCTVLQIILYFKHFVTKFSAKLIQRTSPNNTSIINVWKNAFFFSFSLFVVCEHEHTHTHLLCAVVWHEFLITRNMFVDLCGKKGNNHECKYAYFFPPCFCQRRKLNYISFRAESRKAWIASARLGF